MVNKLKIVIILILLATTTYAASDSSAYPRLNKDYFKSYFTDSKDLVCSPAKWQSKQWISLGGVATAGILAYTQDEHVQDYFMRHRSVTAGKFSKYIFEPFGSGVGTGILVSGVFLGGTILKDERLKGTALTSVKAFIVSSLFTQFSKQLSHRHRPYQDEIPDHAQWEGPLGDIHYASFPSGHSSAAFSVATVFAMEYRETVWVPALAYTLAAGTAISRLYDNKHWVSDVVIGSAFGFVTGRFIWKQSRRNISHIRVIPDIQSNTSSLLILIPISYKR